VTPIRIDDPADPRLRSYRDLRDRDHAADGGFMAEGEVVLQKLAAGARFAVDSVLLAEGRVEPMRPITQALGAQLYIGSQAVVDAVAGFHLHRGVLAYGRRPALLDPAALLAELGAQALVVVLLGIANMDNMGGLFRNAAAFGADAVLLDAACCDPLYRKAIRTSVGAALTVPFARFAPGADPVAALATAGFEALALSPSGAQALREVAPAPRTAALFGTEGPGLAPQVLARCRTVRIVMAGGFDSLNVATTSGIVLHHLRAAALIDGRLG
jgi:tRNA G18 (ribose-2'-O)-methylase SpoU